MCLLCELFMACKVASKDWLGDAAAHPGSRHAPTAPVLNRSPLLKNLLPCQVLPFTN